MPGEIRKYGILVVQDARYAGSEYRKAVKPMQRQQHLQELWEQISELKTLYQRLGPRLIQEGNRLQDPGRLPDLDLLEEVSAAAGQHKELVDGLEQLAEGLNLSRESWKTDSLLALESFWEEIHVQLEKLLLVEQQTRDAAAVVERALEAELPEGDSPAELERFRQKLRTYKEILFQRTEHEEAGTLRRQLIEGNHPLVALLRLAEGEEMALPDAVELFWKVEEEFGRLFAVASARKSLLFPQEIEPAEPAIADEDRQMSAPLPEPVEQKEEDEPELNKKIPLLICNLIRDGKLSPAYWLACYAEQEDLESPLPSWFIKALELADIVQREDGPAARWLSQIFEEQDFLALVEESNPSSQLPYTLLAFAASLRPHIVLPSSKARFVLENLRALPPGLDHLSREVIDTVQDPDISGVDAGGFQDSEKLFSLLHQASASLDSLEGECSRDDYLAVAGVAAARKALESLELYLQQQDEEYLAAPGENQEQEEVEQDLYHGSEELQKPSPATIDRLGKEILKYFAKREERPEASSDAELEQETMPKLW